MCPRFSVSRNTISYFSQARIVLLDNSYLLRWVRKFRLFDAGPYAERNYVQYNLVMLATVAMFIVELCLVVPGLPASRQIYHDSDKMVRWESEYLKEARFTYTKDHPCTIAPVIDGPNVKSESFWTYCQDNYPIKRGFVLYPADKMMLSVTIPEKVKGRIDLLLEGEGMLFHSRQMVHIPLHKDSIAVVALSDNRTTFLRNLRRNFDLLRNVSGLSWTFLPDLSGEKLWFQVNASRMKKFPPLENATKQESASLWIAGIARGMMTLRPNTNGSELFKRAGFVNGVVDLAIPLENQKILVGEYIGTLVPAFFIVVFTAATILAHIVVCIFLRSPPGGAWELLEAHGRDHGDRILAGPPGHAFNTQEKDGNREENLEGPFLGRC